MSEIPKDIPALIKEFSGVEMPENTHTLLTILALVAIIYGADFIKQIVADGIKDTPVRRWKKELIADLAGRTGRTYDDVKSILDERYGKKGARRYGNSHIGFGSSDKRRRPTTTGHMGSPPSRN